MHQRRFSPTRFIRRYHITYLSTTSASADKRYSLNKTADAQAPRPVVWTIVLILGDTMSANTFQKPLLGVALATGFLLLIPAVAMQFTTEVTWGSGDFVTAAILLFSAGAAAVMSRSYVNSAGRRALLTFAIALCFALVWAELAVGLFH